ncbi:ankyrin repeat and LEM domain-containing protein 2 isoform X2 [Pseudomyrmex gracilis]|uniref:ankyrin repeat and LEM domain-containing protein 2 isoform X2 n=1 Tax=Pseudomyrmex gracilis TaxID=219809 RepID=UPI000994F413|nr:ankyrin repeat and LEM domain-containing protein 2 isoform X2 [Pseudomyrmex gracilis]
MSSLGKRVTFRSSSETVLWYQGLASHRFVMTLLKRLSDDKTVAMNENENENTETTRTVCKPRPNLTNETMFHAVYVPQDKDSPVGEIENIHVYEDMSQALEVIKEHKKARVKTFKNRSDAEAYARTGEQLSLSNSFIAFPVVAMQEQSSNFKTLKSQELVSFRKLIENGDLESVKRAVWENPRYLISSGDTPAILQTGYRYNPLHVAAKAGKAQMCEFILNTVGDVKFMQWHSGNVECVTYLDPVQIMLDLYLNTPDKGLNETPLHFAVKFGFKDVVRVLVSYSQCQKDLRNKYEQLPIDIICSRKCQEDEELKREIYMLLEDQFYVPVLRAEGNTYPPIIGEPFSPTSPLRLNKDPISPRVEVRAFAGPMTKSEAVEFRKKWKTPPRIIIPKKGQGDACSIENSPMLALRLKDTEKGLERIGRNLAEECHVSWKEYWPFLEDFVDLRSDEGLTKLETYFQEKFKEYNMFYPASIQKKLCSTHNDAPANCEQSTEKMENAIDELCKKLNSCSLQTETDRAEDTEEDIDDLEYYTPSSSPKLVHSDSESDMENAEEEDSFPATFIQGASPTKEDYAVYNALSSVICPDVYPHVYRWRHNMQLIMKRDPNRFNDMKLFRRKLFNN